MPPLPASEARLARAWLSERSLWLALIAGVILWSAAYQLPTAPLLHLGGDRATQLRWHDEPFLQGFNAPEPGARDWWSLPDAPYRWAENRATITLPGAGGGDWRVAIVAASGRADGSAIPTTWQIGNAAPIAVTIAAEPRVYRLIGPATNGDLRIAVESPRFDAPGDPRNLGLVVFRAAAAPLGGLRTPPVGQLLLLLTIVAGAAALVRRHLPADARLTAAVGGGGVLLFALLIATERIALGAATPALAALIWICYGLGALIVPATARLAAALGVAAPAWEARAAAGAAVAAFGVRMAGLLHPYARFSDLGLNVNNLTRTIFGEIFLTTGLPCEAGAGPQPYPPGQYLLLAPARLLIGDDRTQIGRLIQGGVALLESLSAALVWLALRRAGVGARGALAGAALYIVAPPLLRSFSIGEMANMFGQALVAPLLLYLAYGARSDRAAALVAGAAVIAALFLGHTGVTLSAAALLAAWGMWRLIARDGRALRNAVVSGGAAGIVALSFFYSAFLYIPAARAAAAAELASQGVICPPGRPLDAKLGGIAAATFAPDALVAPIMLVAGGVGALLLLGGGASRALGSVLAASWLGAALSFATLLSSDQTVRWQHFLFPAICIGGGAALAALARRGRVGRILALLLLVFLIWRGLAQWVEQIATYLH